MMDAGQLRHRITLQSRSVGQDSRGGQTTTWVDVATVWASIAPATGREFMTAQAMAIDAPRTVTIRWQPAFASPIALAAMRIKYGTRIFNIHSAVDEAEAHREITILCGEGLNNG